MKRILIGHRGVGKTHLLKRHQHYFQDVAHFDLDHEIQNRVQISLSDFFNQQGEAAFRKIENLVYSELINNDSYVISVGAGFDVSQISEDIEVVYISRCTDAEGRIFLNRPRLEPNLSPLDEYKKRYHQREPQFLKRANWIYFLSEGIEEANEIEEKILKTKFQINDAYYTSTPHDLTRLDIVSACFKNLELRTDLLSPEDIGNIANTNNLKINKNNLLLSIRNSDSLNKQILSLFHLVDFDLNFVEHNQLHFEKQNVLISSHLDNIHEALQKLNQYQGQFKLKLCPLINNFEELLAGYNWQQQDSENRNFLPRSTENGKWVWFRQLSKYWQSLNFVKNSVQVLDQPSAYEWLVLPALKPLKWAAVLGSPVYFSRSPLAHQNYFANRSSFFTKIDLSPTELKQHFQFLINLGLSYAAVTSPLKETLFELSGNSSEIANQLKSANTFYFHGNQIYSHNTDIDGFNELAKNILNSNSICVWGGGGTLEMLKKVLPQAQLYSSQTGQSRSQLTTVAAYEQITKFDHLVWAAPRLKQTLMPSEALQFNTVIDLNYLESSLGLEFAAQQKISYISGIEMFKAQAKAQQLYWHSQELKQKNKLI